jgi:DNA-binding GntR family transcriptional regulator
MHEGLVRILPRKGVLVQPLSMDEFADLIAVARLQPQGHDVVLEPAIGPLVLRQRLRPALRVLLPRQVPHEAGLCAEFGIGRTPVNKALHRLMHEGLVRILPRKGVLRP